MILYLLLPDLDPLKVAKIKEFAQNAVLTGKPMKINNPKSQKLGELDNKLQ